MDIPVLNVLFALLADDEPIRLPWVMFNDGNGGEPFTYGCSLGVASTADFCRVQPRWRRAVFLGCGTVTHNTGKTAMSMAAALATGREIGVLCPVVGRAGWERFRHFGAQNPGFWRPTRPFLRRLASGDRQQARDGNFWWKKPEDLILILDEAQAVRHDTSLTFEVCDNAIRQQIPMVIASAIATSPIEMRSRAASPDFTAAATSTSSDSFRRTGCYEQGRTWNGSGRTTFMASLFCRGCRAQRTGRDSVRNRD